MLVRVLQEDISTGHPHDSFRCPLAYALNRAIPEQGPWQVSLKNCYDEDSRCTSLPPSAVFFRQDFDQGVEVLPFEFNLDLSEEK